MISLKREQENYEAWLEDNPPIGSCEEDEWPWECPKCRNGWNLYEDAYDCCYPTWESVSMDLADMEDRF